MISRRKRIQGKFIIQDDSWSPTHTYTGVSFDEMCSFIEPSQALIFDEMLYYFKFTSRQGLSKLTIWTNKLIHGFLIRRGNLKIHWRSSHIHHISSLSHKSLVDLKNFVLGSFLDLPSLIKGCWFLLKIFAIEIGS